MTLSKRTRTRIGRMDREDRIELEMLNIEAAEGFAVEFVTSFFRGDGAHAPFCADDLRAVLSDAFDVFFTFRKEKIAQFQRTADGIKE